MSKISISGPTNQSEGGVLASLWRNILEENKYIHILDVLVNRYLRKSADISLRSKNIKRQSKSTLINNITAPEMTIKTFMYLIFNLIGATKLTLTIKLTYANGGETLHTVEVDSGDMLEEGEENERKDNKSGT
jgi:hypothetical protein